MARKIKDADLDTRTARERLAIRGRPHYRRIEANLAIGYRRLRGKSGTFTARHYIGDQSYAYDVLGVADDRSDADGVEVLNFDQAVAKAREIHLERAKQAAGIHGPLTVDQVMADYVTALDHGGKNTAHVEKAVAKYIAPLIGKIEVAKLTSEKLRKWLADIAVMPARGRAFDPVARKATANRTLTVLQAALNLAYKADKVSSDKAWKSVQRFKNANRRRGRFVSVDEARRLINACDPDFRMMVQAALATGCRYAELCALRVSDFQIDHKTLSIRHSKSGKPRSVYLTDEGVELFKQLAAGRRAGDPLIRRDDGLPFGASHQIRRMVEACKNARIYPITFHGLRHSYASALVKRGVPLFYVAQSLGHASIKMVQEHYGHIEQTHLSETIRASVPEYGFAKTSNVTTIHKR